MDIRHQTENTEGKTWSSNIFSPTLILSCRLQVVPRRPNLCYPPRLSHLDLFFCEPRLHPPSPFMGIPGHNFREKKIYIYKISYSFYTSSNYKS